MSDCRKCQHVRPVPEGWIWCNMARNVVPEQEDPSGPECDGFEQRPPASAAPAPKPPTLPLLEAARCMLAEFGCVRECRVEEVGNEPVHFLASGEDSILHGPEYIPAVCPACALRSAIAAEEERAKTRRAAAEAIMAHIAHEADANCPYRPYSEEVIRWAKMETSR